MKDDLPIYVFTLCLIAWGLCLSLLIGTMGCGR